MPNELAATIREILTYEKEVNDSLRQTYARRSHWEASDFRTPLDELLEREDNAAVEWSVKGEAARRLFEYFVQDGLEPQNVLRNVFAVAAHMDLEVWAHLTRKEKALILGDDRAAEDFRSGLMLKGRKVKSCLT